MGQTTISTALDRINLTLGRGVAWLALAMVFLTFINVIQRYLFDTSLIWQQELVRSFHAALLMSAAGYTLLKDQHVRVDVLSQNFSARTKHIVSIIGTILFLFPFIGAIAWCSSDFITHSWSILEASPEYNGLPGIFILKTFIWVFSFSLFLQGVSTIVTSVHALNNKEQ